jgi:hypothetical protein
MGQKLLAVLLGLNLVGTGWLLMDKAARYAAFSVDKDTIAVVDTATGEVTATNMILRSDGGLMGAAIHYRAGYWKGGPNSFAGYVQVKAVDTFVDQDVAKRYEDNGRNLLNKPRLWRVQGERPFYWFEGSQH